MAPSKTGKCSCFVSSSKAPCSSLRTAESNANPIQKHRNIPLHTTLRDLNPPEREDHSFQDPSQIDKLAAFMTPSQTSLTNPASPNPNKPLPPAPAFNFLSLPPELRLCIYDLVLRGRDRDLEELSVIKMVGPNFFIGSHQPAFSRVCRQMREESLPMFYRGNAFHIDFGAPDVFYRQEHDMLSHWIGIIGDANASHLKTVIVASRVLHLKALTLECEAGQFPMGKGRLQMYQQGFQEAFRRHEYERREKSLWLMRTFLMNGFEVGEDALITGE